jgi:hypothetical protein
LFCMPPCCIDLLFCHDRFTILLLQLLCENKLRLVNLISFSPLETSVVPTSDLCLRSCDAAPGPFI